MHLASGNIHPTPYGGRSRIHLLPEECDAVLANNPGASVTIAVSRVATEVTGCHRLPPP